MLNLKSLKRYHCVLIIFVLTTCSCRAASFQIDSIRTSSDHLVATNHGVVLHIREIQPSGHSGFPPLVMVHGGGPGATSSFDLPVDGGSFAREFTKRGIKVYLLNIRGWERSSLPIFDATDSTTVLGSVNEAVKDITSGVEWILQREGIKKINLFGWATGGHWCSAFATEEPNLIHKLISLNSLYGVNAPWELRKYFSDNKDSTIFRKESFFRVTKRENLSDSWTRNIPIENKEEWRDPAIEDAYCTYATQFGDDTLSMKVPGGYREESFYMSLGKKYWDARDIKIPVLVIRTELDFWSRPEDLIAFKKDLQHHKNGSFITIPGTHYVFLDRNNKGREKLVQVMLDFINQP